MSKSFKLKSISKTIGSGITPLRSNPLYWDDGTVSWLKTEQLGEHKIYATSEKITQLAIDQTSIKIFPKNTLSIAMYGEGRTRGNVSILKNEMTTNQACCNIVIDEKKADYEYVYYFLKTQYSNLRSLSSGVRKNLNSNDIKEFEIRLPNDLLSQQKIAKVLSDLDAKIELNNKINIELEAMAKTLYDYWFVQFDFPDANGKPYKTSGGKMVWNEELKREIPEGWEVKKIKDIAKTGSGGTPLKSKKEFYENGNIPWINSGEVNEPFIISTKKFITKKGLDNSSAKLFPKGTILMAMYGATAGQVSLIDIEASTNQAICAIIPNDNRLIPYVKFEMHQLYEYLISLSTGSARDNLSQDKIKELFIVIPEENIIEEFYKVSNSSFEKILINLKQNQELASLRDWLLPMLMNGQVSVGEVAKEYQIEEEVLGMVAEPIEKLKSKKEIKVIALKPSYVDIYKRTLLAAEIVFQLHNEATLGHLKLQKLLYLCQEINNMSLPMNFLKQAMGPYDNRLMRSLDKQFEEKKWFKFEKTEYLKYKPLVAVGSHQKDYLKYFDADKQKIDYLINIFRKYKSNDIEAVATLYACWKEAIENNELVNLELILKKFYSWSKEKEKFNPDDLKKHLSWMKNNGIYPKR
jgi:type I restriction enzyme S subunit